jgi:hypothetical protein
MDVVQGSTINADVLKQARFGSMLTIALFHDLQDPLFHQYSFNADDFLKGVQPALTNFHGTIGQLQNEFPTIHSKEERTERLLQRMHQIVTSSMHDQNNNNNNNNNSPDGKKGQGGITLPDNAWTEQAHKDPDSHAAKLSAMVSPKVFDSLFLTTETQAMLASYKAGSTTVSNVALLSARAMVMDEDEYSIQNNGTILPENEELDNTITPAKMDHQKSDKIDEEKDEGALKMDSTGKASEEAGNNSTGSEEKGATNQNGKMKASDAQEPALKEVSGSAADEDPPQQSADNTLVAAQIEVLYEMNQTIEVKPEIFDDTALTAVASMMKSSKETPDGSESDGGKDDNGKAASTPRIVKEETQIWVGTFEGWLNGGPGGALQWRITRLRPPSAEFPGLYDGF